MADSTTEDEAVVSVEELQRQILDCKRLALARKREGDIESAKQALLQSRRLQLQLDEAVKSSVSPPAVALAPAPVSDTTTRTATTETSTCAPPPSTDSETADGEATEPPVTETTDNAGSIDDDDDDDDSQLLQQLDYNQDDADDEAISDQNHPSSFSLSEMMDLEMIREFATGGLPIPSLEDYQAKIESCKRSALSFKQQNKTKEALQQMRCLKQLHAVYKALEPIFDGVAVTGLVGPGDEDETEEEKALLRELLLADENSEHFDGDAMGGSTSLELDDLIEMDLSEIQDAMALGMQLPSVETIQKQVNEQKSLALQLKQSGDLEGAKAALVKFKTWSQHASAVEQLLENAKKTSRLLQLDADPENTIEAITPNDIREEDLETFLAADEKPPNSVKPSKPKPPAPKSSEELRQEAIRLRDEKKLTEATAVLKLYKEALAQESQEAEMKERKEIIQRLQTETETALKQQDRFYFYQELANSEVGSQQIQAWFRYADLCRKVATLVRTKGSKAVTITTEGKEDGPAAAGSLRLLPEDLTDVIRTATDPTDERVECCILDVMELHVNKSFQTLGKNSKLSNVPDWIQLETHVSIQLPLNVTETDKPINLYFYSRPIERQIFWDSVRDNDKDRQQELDSGISQSPEDEWSKRGRVAFASSKDGNGSNAVAEESHQYLTLARGDSKFAKTLLRRMERRKITVTVHCHQHHGPSANQSAANNKLKGWFGGGKGKQDSKDAMEPLSLGKVVLETKDLLEHCCIVGEYPLIGNGKRPVGGKLRLCMRTGVPFGGLLDTGDAAGISVDTKASDLPLYSEAMKFSVTKADNEGSPADE
jgi:hypothetical protein